MKKTEEKDKETKKTKEERTSSGFGVDINNKWIPIEKFKTKKVYKKLLKKRMKRQKELYTK